MKAKQTKHLQQRFMLLCNLLEQLLSLKRPGLSLRKELVRLHILLSRLKEVGDIEHFYGLGD
jgi:hypothetical protein